MAFTVEDCTQTAKILRETIADLPTGARALRTTLARYAYEYEQAVKMSDLATLDGIPVEILPVGGIAPGDSIMLPAGIAEIRRISDTGVETNVDGFWGWTPISSRTAPVAAVTR